MTGFFARWCQRFFFDPKYLANSWEFCKKNFTTLCLSASSTNSPYLRWQFYFRFGGRPPPKKKNFDPKLTKNWEIYLRQNFAQWSALGCSCDPPNLVKIWQQNFEKLRKNRIFALCFFSDFVTQSRIWRQPPKSFTELSRPFYTDNKYGIQ